MHSYCILILSFPICLRFCNPKHAYTPYLLFYVPSHKAKLVKPFYHSIDFLLYSVSYSIIFSFEPMEVCPLHRHH